LDSGTGSRSMPQVARSCANLRISGSILFNMVSRISHGMMWNHPPRKKLYLLIALVVGALTVVSITLILRSRDLEKAPQAPLDHPMIGYLISPQRSSTLPA
jgi:hypothetical protein